MKRSNVKTRAMKNFSERVGAGSIPQMLGLCSLTLIFAVAAAPPPETGRRIVAADHILVSNAGKKVLTDDGNAFDAAVGAALAAGVVQPAGSGLGGGGFAVYSEGLGDGKTLSGVLDFRERAPKVAHQKMYVDDAGKVIPNLSRVGGKAVAVPAEGAGLARLLKEHGQIGFRRVAQPAVELAMRGFAVGAHLERALANTRHMEVLEFFSKDGRPPKRYEVFRNKALGRTIKRWAGSQGASLHGGQDAQALVSHVQEVGGGLQMGDLTSYQPVRREPVEFQYKGYRLITMPPPSSGGVVLAQVLQGLQRRDVVALGHNSSRYVHLLAEAMKHAYADRAHHMGDPDFVEVPVATLIDEKRVQEVVNAFDETKTFESSFYGPLIAPLEDAGTQHISVHDGVTGVALTTTINTSFGSGVVVPELGLILNNEMDDFAAAPGVPNAFGLVGSDANAVAPGKRPLSSMTPTVVLNQRGETVMVLGASGGSTIISACIQVFLNIVEFGMDPQEAVAAPRMHHQWIPDTLVLEPEFPADVVQALKDMGHTVQLRSAYSSVQVVHRTPRGLAGGADPRKGGWPAAER